MSKYRTRIAMQGQLKLVRLAACLVFCLCMLMAWTPSKTSAEPIDRGLLQDLTNYCQDHASSKVDPGCNDTNMVNVRRAAEHTSACEAAAQKDKSSCYLREGKAIISDALKGAHSASDFTNNLNTIFKKRHLDVSSDTTDSQKALPPQTQDVTAGNEVKTVQRCGDTGGDDGLGVKVSVAIGCEGKGNPILDLSFAIIRFLSNGAALVLVGSLAFGGIQYSLSRGDPQAMNIALNRIKSVMGALLIFIFAYAILNYILPAALLK